MKKKRWNPGQLYQIRFLDHSTNGDGPVEFQIVGWLIENKPKYVVLSNWWATEDPYEHVEKDVIIKSTIISVENLSACKTQ